MTALRATKPTAVQKRLKLFLYGPAGTRKTTTALMFPHAYMIDTERGAENPQYASALEAGGGVYFATGSLDDVIAETRALLTEPHSYLTLVVDPINVPYNNAADEEALRLAEGDKDGTEFGRNKKAPDRKMKRLCSLLLKLDMNVVLTSHARTKWERTGGDFREAGVTFDGYAKLDYLFDLVIETSLRGMEGWGTVRKSRIASMPMGESFALSYDALAEKYGREALERGATPVELASPEQVARMAVLAANVKLSDKLDNAEVVQKWLDKADAETLADLPASVIQKCIEFAEARTTTSKESENAEVQS